MHLSKKRVNFHKVKNWQSRPFLFILFSQKLPAPALLAIFSGEQDKKSTFGYQINTVTGH